MLNEVLKEEAELTKPDRPTIEKIKKISADFCRQLRSGLKRIKVPAEVFVGGSLAKSTIVRREIYDIDIFVRFPKKYREKIPGILKKIVGRKAKKVHGSRDYYRLSCNGIIIEIIPVLKIKEPSEAENITDLSYFHVGYVLKEIAKNKKLSDEIILAKAFAHSCDCYGAESYINGFSGYALELLVIHYRSFLKMCREISLSKEKIIIDSRKFYKNKKEMFIKMNSSKINSPIILIDPTFKERNACASLSGETYSRFKKRCSEFLKNPGKNFFIKKDAEAEFSRQRDFIKLEVETDKQAGDIAGTKLKKFSQFFNRAVSREFTIKKSGFFYDENENQGRIYLVIGKKKDEIVKGPHITKVDNLAGFRKVHKNAFIKNDFAYAKIRHEKKFPEWFALFRNRYKNIIRDMGVRGINLRRI